MTKDQIEEAARAAGLLNPRVIPLRKLTQEVVWRLWWGPDNARQNVELPRDPAAAQVQHVLDLVA